MDWIDVKTKKPLVYKSGNWDGKCSEKVLVKLKDGTAQVADLNEGVLDGFEFSIWYDIKSFELDSEVVAWMPIPE
ncbi:hypothetical protein [Thalassobellus suaedae]|uniref:DUF551 domain-containing protein n=1 Tax=Thalassobellus suaedae TaxID=3074124 RepID=A0ABY9XVV3_9FLAO|nr:hypothetical protein RHP51_05170 [Flavobacteriaceae bacterium HL-DH14]